MCIFFPSVTFKSPVVEADFPDLGSGEHSGAIMEQETGPSTLLARFPQPGWRLCFLLFFIPFPPPCPIFPLFLGYNTVVRIPAGATNIDIKQVSYSGKPEDDNYLGECAELLFSSRTKKRQPETDEFRTMSRSFGSPLGGQRH